MLLAYSVVAPGIAHVNYSVHPFSAPRPHAPRLPGSECCEICLTEKQKEIVVCTGAAFVAYIYVKKKKRKERK